MTRFSALAMSASAIVLGFHSGSLLLGLAATCGACGVAALMPAESRQSTVGGRR